MTYEPQAEMVASGRSGDADEFGSVTGEQPLDTPATMGGGVDGASDLGVAGFCLDGARPHRCPTIEAVCGDRILATSFALLPHPAAADRGFLLRWSDFDADAVQISAAREPQSTLVVRSGGVDLSWSHDPITLAEVAARVSDLPVAVGAPDLAGDYRLIRLGGLFDERFYLDRHTDVAAAGIDPLLHYLVAGEAEGRCPSYYFDPAVYGAADPGAVSGTLLSGYLRGTGGAHVATSIHFDGAWYADTYAIGPSDNPLRDFMANRRTRSPNPYFDVERYLERYADLRELHDPYMHFAEWGVREGRQASSTFHGKFYRQTYLGDDPSQNAFLHFLTAGRHLGHLPTPARDTPSVAGEVRTFSQPGAHFEMEPVAADLSRSDIKAFAFYLPQFHAIAENDAFWGTGFTEWRNLSRGQPRFVGHYQPRAPRDLGFYDLSHQEVIRQHVRTAMAGGIFGFCYYFYWFNGSRVLDRPLDLFVEDETLSMPFCLLWANENWTRRWDGQEQDVLLRQDYDPAHDEALFDCLSGYFASPRYYRVGGRPLLILYRPGLIPGAPDFFQRLRAGIRTRIGVEPLVFMSQAFGDEDPRPFGLDGAVEFPPHKVTANGRDIAKRQHFLDWNFNGQVFDYEEIAAIALADEPKEFPLVKTVLPMWDNDARKQGNGLCIHGSTPAKFASWLEATCEIARRHPVDGEKLVFINAWNEWCEGTYLEPDLHYGWAYLNTVARVLSRKPAIVSNGRRKILLVGHDAFPAGAQYLLLNIGRQLLDFGFDVTFYLLRDGALLDAYREIAPVVLQGDEEAGTFLQRLREEGFAHALTNTSASGAMVPWLKASGFAVVSLVHELPSLITFYGLEESCRAIAEQADTVVFAASYVAERFYALTRTGAERGLLREQGLYTEGLATGDGEALRAELGLPPDARVVLGVGYGDLRKGVDVFATFSRQLAARDPGIHFIWVGALDPAVGTWIQTDRDRAGVSNLHFVGHRSDVSSFYALSDLVFLASREDPYPTVVLEALANGRAVIGFAECGGFTDLLADQQLGRIVPFGDFPAFEAALRDLLSSRHDGALREHRADFVREHFGWADYCFDLARMLFPDLRPVSVVVPNYNYAGYIEERLTSIFAQTYPVREIIVLDDASRDDSIAAITGASETAARTVELLVNRRNSGSVFRQWKKGLDEAHGEVVWIAEADDGSSPDFLERLVTSLSALPSPGFAFCDSEAIDGTGALIYESYKGYYAADGDAGLAQDATFAPADFLGRFLTTRNLVLNVSSVVWDAAHLRHVFERLGDEAFRFTCAGDWRIYLESCRLGGTVGYVADVLNRHRRHEVSVTHALSKPHHFAEIAAVQAIALASSSPDVGLREGVERFQDKLRSFWELDRTDLAA